MGSAWIAGSYQSDFARNFAREGLEISGVGALDGIEAHDCFSLSKYMAIDHFGITEPGESGCCTTRPGR